MGQIPLYVNIGLGVYFLVLLLFAILFGVKRGLFRALSRMVTIIISLPIAYFLSKFLLELLVDKLGLIDTIVENFSEGDIAFTADSLSSVVAVVVALCVPLLFIFVYFIVNKIMLIFYAISKKWIKKGQTKGSKIGGVVISILTCTISFSTLVLPLGGYIGLVSDGSAQILEMTEDPDKTLVDSLEMVSDLSDSGFFKVTKGLSNGTFKLMTSVKLKSATGKTKKSNAKSELLGTLEVVNDIAELSDQELSTQDTLRQMANSLDYKGKNSVYAIKIAFAKLLNEAGTEWKEGNEYFGINMRQEFEDQQTFDTFSSIFDLFISANEDNLHLVMTSMANLVDAEENLYEYLSSVNEGTATSEKLVEVIDFVDELNHKTFIDLIALGENELTAVAEGDSEKFVSAYQILFDKLYEAKANGTYKTPVQIEEYNLSLSTPLGTINKYNSGFEVSEVEAVDFAINKFFDYVKHKDVYNETYFSNETNTSKFCLDLNKLLDEILEVPALYDAVKEVLQLELQFTVTPIEKTTIDAIIESKKAQNGLSQEQKEVLEGLKTFFI